MASLLRVFFDSHASSNGLSGNRTSRGPLVEHPGSSCVVAGHREGIQGQRLRLGSLSPRHQRTWGLRLSPEATKDGHRILGSCALAVSDAGWGRLRRVARGDGDPPSPRAQ
jgi:hypothetical protein